MKLSLISLLLASASAHAAEVNNAVLHQVIINGEATPYVAELAVNPAKEVEISILNDICGHFASLPPGTMRCMAMPIPVTTLRAKVLSQSNDGCNSSITLAKTDSTPSDGLRTEISVKDHARRTCDDLRPYILEVEATVFNPWTSKTTSYVIH